MKEKYISKIKPFKFFQTVSIFLSEGTLESDRLMKDINKIHTGDTRTPENPTKEHINAIHNMNMVSQAIIELEIQKSGEFKPIEITMSNVIYDLVPRKIIENV